MNPQTEALEACPWCGESNARVCKTTYLDRYAYAVACRTRDCHGAIFSLAYGQFPTEAEAIAAWNHRTTPAADDVERVETYAEWQQKRGMLADAVDWAIEEYRGFMLDDDYDAQRVLDRIIERLKEVANITRQALAPGDVR